MQHILTGRELVIYDVLHDSGSEIARFPGAKLSRLTALQIQKRLPEKGVTMSVASIRRGLIGLIRKRAIAPWSDETQAVGERGPGATVPCWLVRSWKDSLRILRDDPQIARIGNSVFVRGPGRDLMTADELKCWKPDEEALRRAGARALPIGAEWHTGDEDSKPVPPAAPKPATPKQKPPAPRANAPPAGEFRPDEAETILEILKQCCQPEPPQPEDGVFVMRRAREFRPDAPVEVIAACIQSIAAVRRKGDSNARLTPGFFVKLLPGHLMEWSEGRRKFALKAAKAAGNERDRRINELAQQILAHEKAPGPNFWVPALLEASDPQDVADARALAADYTAGWTHGKRD